MRGLLVLGGLGFAVGSYFVAPRLLGQRFQYALSDADPGLAAHAARFGYRPETLRTDDGVELQGVVRTAKGQRPFFILYFQGNTPHQLDPAIPFLEGIRGERDVGVAVWSYRGFDGSTGDPSPEAAARDARAALRHLVERYGASADRVLAMGFSMGSGIALRLTAEQARPGAKGPALVILSPFWSLRVRAPQIWGRWVPPHRYEVSDVVGNVRSPVLVVGAAKDSALPVEEHAQKIARALGDGAEYWELPQATHSDYLGTTALRERVAHFLDRWMSGY